MRSSNRCPLDATARIDSPKTRKPKINCQSVSNAIPLQAIRPCVIFRKVTYCFRSPWGAELYADIRSVIETGRRRAIDALEAIRLTLHGKPLAAPAPS
jgi:hypothetical protein